MSKLTDFFWPILDEITEERRAKNKASLEADRAAIETLILQSHDEIALEEARRVIDSEESRRRTGETKATTYLLFTGAITPLLTYLETSVWDGKVGTAPKWIAILILFVAVLYLLASAWWSFKAIEVSGFNRVDVSEICESWAGSSPTVTLVRLTLKIALSNRPFVNRKISFNKLAHAFIVRSFIAFGVLLLVECVSEAVDLLPYKLVRLPDAADSLRGASPPVAVYKPKLDEPEAANARASEVFGIKFDQAGGSPELECGVGTNEFIVKFEHNSLTLEGRENLSARLKEVFAALHDRLERERIMTLIIIGSADTKGFREKGKDDLIARERADLVSDAVTSSLRADPLAISIPEVIVLNDGSADVRLDHEGTAATERAVRICALLQARERSARVEVR